MDLKERLFGHNTPTYPLDYVNDIGEAIIRVEEKYCNWAYNTANHNQKTERVFAYELYYQFKLFTHSNAKYNGLRLYGEIDKRVTEEIEMCGLGIENMNQSRYSPDLVIHTKQTNRDIQNQKLIIEIKTKRLHGESGDREIKRTILKLNHYLRVLNFQYAIFLSVNTELADLSRQLTHFFRNPTNQQWEDRFKRIIVMNYNERIY